MATICWIAIEQDESGCVTSTETFNLFSDSSALRLSSFQSIRPALIGCRPMKTFSATERFGQRLISWYTVLIPSRCAAMGESGLIGLPSRSISPESGLYTPVSTLTSVDFPAPFWPMIACTSPLKRRKSTCDNAFTPGKCLLIFLISRIGALSDIPTPPLCRLRGHTPGADPRGGPDHEMREISTGGWAAPRPRWSRRRCPRSCRSARGASCRRAGRARPAPPGGRAAGCTRSRRSSRRRPSPRRRL